MILDALVLGLSLFALRQLPGMSSIWMLLFRDGIFYFVGTFHHYVSSLKCH